jgi:hypothetical protein
VPGAIGLEFRLLSVYTAKLIIGSYRNDNPYMTSAAEVIAMPTKNTK